MTIYICIEAVLLVLLFKKKPHHIGYSLISIGLLLISAFRAESVGTDVVNYIIEYNLHGIETWKESFTNSEYTFAIYCKFLNVLGLKERGFLIATAILFAMLLMIALHVNHCDKILTFSLFYFAGLYLQSFCIIRQSLAIVTALISYSSLEKNYSIQMPYNKLSKISYWLCDWNDYCDRFPSNRNCSLCASRHDAILWAETLQETLCFFTGWYFVYVSGFNNTARPLPIYSPTLQRKVPGSLRRQLCNRPIRELEKRHSLGCAIPYLLYSLLQ